MEVPNYCDPLDPPASIQPGSAVSLLLQILYLQLMRTHLSPTLVESHPRPHSRPRPRPLLSHSHPCLLLELGQRKRFCC